MTKYALALGAFAVALGISAPALAEEQQLPSAVRKAIGKDPGEAEGLPPRYVYREGTPIPAGYHLEERPRAGFVKAGFITTGVAYSTGLIGAFSANFANQSGWLALPFAGPWITIGRREYGCFGKRRTEEGYDAAKCLGDTVVVPLIFLGMAQAAGGTFLAVGYIATREWAVRDDAAAFTVIPAPVGSGYGLQLLGTM
jgi:hypothetical protein